MKKILLLGLIFQSLIILGQEGYLFTIFPKENVKYVVERSILTERETKSEENIEKYHFESKIFLKYEVENEVVENGEMSIMQRDLGTSYESFRNGKKTEINPPIEHSPQRKKMDNIFSEIGFSNLNFPEKEMKIGDTFSHYSVTLFPIENGKVPVHTHYLFTLKEIKNNIAHFKIEPKIDHEKSPMKGDNKITYGASYLEYDFENNVIKTYLSEIFVDYLIFGIPDMKAKIRVEDSYQSKLKND